MTTTADGIVKRRRKRRGNSVSLEPKDMETINVLVYICPTCGLRFEAHIHDVVYERKTLYCVKDKSVMSCAMETIKVKRDANR